MHPSFECPTTVTISITNQCNLRCVYCYSDCNRSSLADELTLEQWLDFVDYLARHNFIATYFEGGEPLVRPGFVRAIEHSSQYMMTWLRTHATLIDRSLAQRLKKAGLGGAFVDLMGATSATHEASSGVAGSFAATCGGIRHLLAAGIDTRVLVILTRRTGAELNQILRLAADLGVAQASVLRLYPIGRAKRLWHELALSLDEQMAALDGLRPPPGVRVAHSWHPHDKNCCWSSVTVNAQGDSIGCPYLREFVNYGNIVTMPLLESWRSDPLYRRLRSGEVAGGCSGCATREGTQGGCRATAYAFSGRWDAPDPFCPEMNHGVDLRVLPDWLVDLPRQTQSRRPARTLGARPPPAKQDGRAPACGQGHEPQAEARSGTYRLVPGTRVREVPERDVCMVYTPRTPSLYALQDEAWLILRECLGRTRAELIECFVSQVVPAGFIRERAAFDAIACLDDLQSKRIIEQVV